jgi:large subunit ribosomal protein L2
MGKIIIPRARGKGGPRYVTPSHRFIGRVEYLPSGTASGRVVDLKKDSGHTAPVAVVKFGDGKKLIHIASEGIQVGDFVNYGTTVAQGNVVPLNSIPEGTKIFSIESFPNSGPKLCRSSGSFALVIGRSGERMKVQFPSGKIMELSGRCRATIGVPAGGGRVDKPWVKGGKHALALWPKAKIFPRSKGVAMTATDHPYGSGHTKRPRPSRSVSRNAPPGAKVGSISPRRMGKRKGR